MAPLEPPQEYTDCNLSTVTEEDRQTLRTITEASERLLSPTPVPEADVLRLTPAPPESPGPAQGGKTWSPLLPRPPSAKGLKPPRCYRQHYRPSHLRQLGLTIQSPLLSPRSFGSHFAAGGHEPDHGDAETPPGRRKGRCPVPQEPELEASYAQEEGGSAAMVAAATTELIAKVAATAKQKRMASHRPSSGKNRCAFGGRSQLATEKRFAALKEGPSPDQLVSLEGAAGELDKALEVKEKERLAEAEELQHKFEEYKAIVTQKFARGWLARRRISRFRAEREEEMREESDRLWREMREPRPVRLVGDLEAMLRAHGGTLATASLGLHEKSSFDANFPRSRSKASGYLSGNTDNSDSEVPSLDGLSDEEFGEYDEEVSQIQTLNDEKQGTEPVLSPAGSRANTISVTSHIDQAAASRPQSAAEQPPAPERTTPSAYQLLAVQEAAEKELFEQSIAKEVEELSRASSPHRDKDKEKERDSRESQKEKEKKEEKKDAFVPFIKQGIAEQNEMCLRATLIKNLQEESAFVRQTDGSHVRDSLKKVLEHYHASCEQHHVKPNSMALQRFKQAEVDIGKDGMPEVSYDFSNSHLGDRGVFCILYALSHDAYCVEVSIRSCGLRGGSAPPIAAFIEMHPRVRHMDLAQNNFSYESGVCILEALQQRSQGCSPEGWSSPQGWKKLNMVSVDLSGTALAWDRGGLTCGPPSGNLWAGHGDSRARYAPTGYEKLREKLDDTQKVKYDQRNRTPSPPHHHRHQNTCPNSPRLTNRAASFWGGKLPHKPSARAGLKQRTKPDLSPARTKSKTLHTAASGEGRMASPSRMAAAANSPRGKTPSPTPR